MKQIEQIDPNFKGTAIKADDATFYDCVSTCFEIEGLYHPHENNRFSRLPSYFAESEEVSEGIRHLMLHTAGGRVRFLTDSPYVALVAKVDLGGAMQHMTGMNQFGFDMYASDAKDRKNSIYVKSFLPPRGIDSEKATFDGYYEFEEGRKREIIINFPMYTTVDKLFIGLKEGCTVQKAEPYTVEKPIVFYGSSITQGGCASRPGNVYTSLLARWLDAAHINLGFSGNDRGEPFLAKYISGLEMSAFVYAYGYNAPSLEHYRNTHYPFYKTIRDKNPALPIIMMSPPASAYTALAEKLDWLTSWRAVVMESYLRAYSEGDKKVYFVDGFGALGDIEAREGTVDGIHPNDNGFYNIAKTIYPVLEFVLRKQQRSFDS